jgi:predicted HAD superfamily Cof-like phosphohydrolase
MTTKMLHEVREWMKAFGQSTPTTPCVPPPDTRRLRDALNNEEAAELLGAETLVECLDAIGDLLVVVNGAAVACGFSEEQVERAFKEIMRSNWTKLWTEAEIESAPDDAWVTRVEGGTGERAFLVKRNDGKVLKSPSYSPAALADIAANNPDGLR